MRRTAVRERRGMPQMRDDVREQDLHGKETVYTERAMGSRWLSNPRGAGADM